MTNTSSLNPLSPEITPKEEHVTLDRPESPNPFLPTSQVEFSFDEIALTTNNEVVLLYLSHLNSEYFEVVSDLISKCCGIRGDIGTDIANITRKQPKPGKNEHETERVHKSWMFSQQKSTMVNLGQLTK
ncbi:hypothetical protein Tco_0761382 [Tanacetum coccineum]